MLGDFVEVDGEVAVLDEIVSADFVDSGDVEVAFVVLAVFDAVSETYEYEFSDNDAILSVCFLCFFFLLFVWFSGWSDHFYLTVLFLFYVCMCV